MAKQTTPNTDTFLSVDLSDKAPVEIAPEGEHLLICRNALVKETDSGRKYILLIVEVENEPDWDDIFVQVWLPNNDDDGKRKRKATQRVIATCEAFGVNAVDQGLDVAEFINSSTYGIVAHRENYQSGEPEARVVKWTSGTDPSDVDLEDE